MSQSDLDREFEDLVGVDLANDIFGDVELAEFLGRKLEYSFHGASTKLWQVLLGLAGIIFTIVIINFAIWAMMFER